MSQSSAAEPDPPAFSGTHLLLDLFGCRRLDDPGRIEAALCAAVAASGATLLELKLHHFGPAMGVTGVALLAESHMSIHSWPEHGYAAVDIFLCGAGHDLGAACAAFVDHLEARRHEQRALSRGFAPGAPADQIVSLPRTKSA